MGRSMEQLWPDGGNVDKALIRQYMVSNVETIAALRLLPLPSNDGQPVYLRGYYADGDGGEGVFHWSATSSTADNGGTVINPTGNSGVGRWLRSVDGGLRLKWFGAKGDGVSDDTAKIQAAIDAAEASGGGTVYVPCGTYNISTGLRMRKGVSLLGEGVGYVGTNSSGNALRAVTINAVGAMSAMLLIKAGTAGQFVFGSQVRGLLFQGNGVVDYGVDAASTSECLLDVTVHRPIYAGIRLSDANGAGSILNDISLQFVDGVGSAHGIVLDGDLGGTNTVTQNLIRSVRGTVKDGWMIMFKNCDNNVVEKCHSSHTGTGGSLYFASGSGNHARVNKVYYNTGPVFAQAGTYGNHIDWMPSESAGVTIQTGAQLHYRVMDSINAEVWRSHEYRLIDELSIPAAAINGVLGTVSAGNTGWLFWRGFADASSGNWAVASVRVPYDWNEGTVAGLSIRYVVNGTSGGAIKLNVGYQVVSDGGSTASSVTDTLTLTPNTTQNVLRVHGATFSAPMAVAPGQVIGVTLNRLGTDAGDTHTGELRIVGITLAYKAEGPDNALAIPGTYSVPNPSFP